MKRCRILIAGLCLWLAAPVVWAGQVVKFGDHHSTLKWIAIKGQATDLAINESGIVYAIGADGRVWKWGRTFPSTWGKLGDAHFSRVTVTPAGKPWAIGTHSQIYRYNGLWWVLLPGQARDIAAGGSAKRPVLAIIDPQGQPLRLDAKKSKWIRFASTGAYPANGTRIAVDRDGLPWVVTKAGNVLKLDKGGAWRNLEGKAKDIATGPAGATDITGLDGYVYQWQAAKSDWRRIGVVADAAVVALGPKDSPWVIKTKGSILASALFDTEPEKKQTTGSSTHAAQATARARMLAERRARSVNTATVTSTLPLQFVKVTGLASQIAIGGDGTVFVIAPGGQLMRWSNDQHMFVLFPGTLSHIAVDKDGNPWGVSGGKIYRFDGAAWRTVPGNANDIAIGYDGTVMALNADGIVYRYDPQFNRFNRTAIGVRANRITVGPTGNPWLITQDGSIYRCEGNSCVRTPLKGAAISIGPDGSVFMTDTNGQLYRWNTDHLAWQRVAGPLLMNAVATGPSGRPWVIDSKNEIYASQFFNRNESGDATEVASASIPTSTSPVSAITFTKSLVFRRVLLGGGSTFGADSVKVGANSVVYMYQSVPAAAAGSYRYDFTQKRFVYLSPQPPAVYFLTAESNGRIWFHATPGGSGDTACWRQKTLGMNSYAEPALDGSHGTTQQWCQDLAIGADGSVFLASDSTTQSGSDKTYLYRYDTKTGKFTLFSDKNAFQSVGVDPNGRPWVVTTDNKVWRYDGKSFVPLPGYGKPQKRDGEWIAVGPTGVVYLTDTSDRLFKWNETNKSFDRVNFPYGNGVVSVAVDGNGLPWAMTGSTEVYRAQ